MYHHPDTLCMEQNLNSIIMKPFPGETIDLTEATKPKKSYRIAGYAYDGGGNMVQKVRNFHRNFSKLYRNFPQKLCSMIQESMK